MGLCGTKKMGEMFGDGVVGVCEKWKRFTFSKAYVGFFFFFFG